MSSYLEYSEVSVICTSDIGVETRAEVKGKLVPRGTFAGTIYELGLVMNGHLVACDAGEQGGGQN